MEKSSWKLKVNDKEVDCFLLLSVDEIKFITPKLAATAAGSNGAINIWLNDDLNFECSAYRNLVKIDEAEFSDISKLHIWVRKWLNKIK